jgi:hypothetical protein
VQKPESVCWPPALHTISVRSPVRPVSGVKGKGEYIYVEGYVRDISGALIPEAVIETDDKGEQDISSMLLFLPLTPATWVRRALLPFIFFEGFYDTQYADRVVADCRGGSLTDAAKDGKYSYRAIVPVSCAIPGDMSSTLLLASVRSLVCPTGQSPPPPTVLRGVLASIR